MRPQCTSRSSRFPPRGPDHSSSSSMRTRFWLTNTTVIATRPIALQPRPDGRDSPKRARDPHRRPCYPAGAARRDEGAGVDSARSLPKKERMPEVFVVGAVRTPLGRRGGGPRRPPRRRPPRRRAAGRRRPRRARPGAGRPGHRRAASRRWASRRSTSRARRGWRPACRSRCPRRRSTASAARASRPARSPRAWSAPGLEDSCSPAASRSMSRIPLGANFSDKALGRPMPDSYFARYAFNSQFQGAELIAKEYGITRADTDAFGLRSQQLAAAPGTRAASSARSCRRSAGARRRRQADRREPPRRARRGPARDVPREARRARSRWSRAACTPRARRRRSPTAPRRCCSPRRRP